MMEYPKINSLWKREGWYFTQDKKNSPDYQKRKQSFIIGEYSESEFDNIKYWMVDEKVDGTNIRIIYTKGVVYIKGRTEDSQLPPHLLEYLRETFTSDLFRRIFQVEAIDSYPNVILFGEGYGPKIQSGGGNYRSDLGFILFDVWIGGWWLQRLDVLDIAEQLNIKTTPEIGIMTESEIVEYVKSKPLSLCSRIPQIMEGVICRSYPLMLFRNGKPIMWKLKCKEFQ
jgi:ATP-dependent RNA circularization protein (DNA/RNA ligase family)